MERVLDMERAGVWRDQRWREQGCGEIRGE